SIGTVMSAFWILSANSFMQHPVGVKYVENNVIGKKAEMIDFFAIIKNPYLWNQFPHILATALTVGSFTIAGIAAWKMLRKHEVAMFRKAFKVSIVAALIGSTGLLITGHSQAQYLVREYPMKMAAAEALYEDTGDSAAFSILAKIDQKQQKAEHYLEIPGMLSFLSYDKFEGSLKGMKTLQKEMDEKFYPVVGKHLDYTPDVPTIYYTFRTMAGSAGLLFLVSLIGTVFAFRKQETEKKWLLQIMPWMLLVAEVATACGWIMAEMGRQPFLIFGVMATESGVSPNSGASVLFSLLVFCVLYTILGIAQFIAFRYTMNKKETTVKEVA
ncbi:MAG: cytochrome ubiquinol oxidase subunit I, partial [Gemella haemolysans]|nr:cytochrome ubiquinol oxidase subunit I [Gemella haemolysans]